MNTSLFFVHLPPSGGRMLSTGLDSRDLFSCNIRVSLAMMENDDDLSFNIGQFVGK